MKHTIASSLALAAVAAVFGGCFLSGTGPAATVRLNQTTITFNALGATVTLMGTVLDADGDTLTDATVSWESADPTVATVSASGLVTAVGNGTTQVTGNSESASGTATVTVQQVVDEIAVVSGDGQTGAPGAQLSQALVVQLEDPRDNAVAAVVVTFAVTAGGGSLTATEVTTGADGQASTSLTLGSEVGLNSVTAAVAGGTADPATFTTAAVSPDFNIQLQFFGATMPTAGQQQAFVDAGDRWRTVLSGDLPDVVPLNVAAASCDADQEEINEAVDDVLIIVKVESIDGAGGTLGQGGPCVVRSGTNLTVLGIMIFDADDFPDPPTADFEATVVHEMGHVFGFGTLWPQAGLLQDPTDPANGGMSGNDTYFSGSGAVTEFDNAGGGPYGGAKVPVENDDVTFMTGSLDSHWRETVFKTELMTPALNGGVPNPLSKVTAASLADMGYTVSLAGADVYVLPPAPPLPAGAAAAGPLIYLVNDVRRGPIYTIDPDGGLRVVSRR